MVAFPKDRGTNRIVRGLPIVETSLSFTSSQPDLPTAQLVRWPSLT